jgi:hypothetical protein
VVRPLLLGLHGRFRARPDCPRASPEHPSRAVKGHVSDPLSVRSPHCNDCSARILATGNFHRRAAPIRRSAPRYSRVGQLAVTIRSGCPRRPAKHRSAAPVDGSGRTGVQPSHTALRLRSHRFLQGRVPTESPQVRVHGGVPTESPRTIRHSTAQSGTDARIASRPVTRLYAGETG